MKLGLVRRISSSLLIFSMMISQAYSFDGELNAIREESESLRRLKLLSDDSSLNGSSLTSFPQNELDGRNKKTIILAQFEIPKVDKDGKPAKKMMDRLVYQYGYGSESEFTFTDNVDLDDNLDDELAVATPEFNFDITYRPKNWLETGLQFRLDKPVVIDESDPIVLPNGERLSPYSRDTSFFIDQAYLTFKKFAGPLELTIGRKNFEDNRHWLYDTSLDVVMLAFKSGYFRTEVSYSREALFDGDLISSEERGSINNAMVVTQYRGVEDHIISGFALLRDDQNDEYGEPQLYGVRVQGYPTRNINYWLEAAYQSGEDENAVELSGYGLDFGTTYRFGGKYNPNFTIAYAFGSGDKEGDNKNTEFRQSGLHSNESKFAGVSEFLVYGEMLDLELSNVNIYTLGFGFFPANNTTLDFVYHRYLLDQFSEEFYESRLTAMMNQNDNQLSKDIGSGLDIIIGGRKVLGIKRLGVDLRMGWFFPGDSFSIGNSNSVTRESDRGFTLTAKFWL